jgi:hypothetical protein
MLGVDMHSVDILRAIMLSAFMQSVIKTYHHSEHFYAEYCYAEHYNSDYLYAEYHCSEAQYVKCQCIMLIAIISSC